MNFNFAYIALRVKIMVPPPHIVYYMVKAVFVFYYKKYKKTRSPLFNDKARKKSDCVLKEIL